MTDIRKQYCKEQKSKLLEAFDKYPSSILLSNDEYNYLLASIERSCNNAATREAENNYIPNFWNDENFRRIYSSVCFRVNANIDLTSDVKNFGLGQALINFMLYKRFQSITAKKFIKITGVRPQVYEHISSRFSNMMKVDPNDVGFMSSEELYPGLTSDIRTEIELRRNQKIELKTSSRYQCGNCHKRQTIIREQQTRSFDESATIFIKCTNCGHEWTRG